MTEEQKSDKKIKILLAEDDKFIARAYTDGLTRSGYEVIAVTDGQEAIKQAKEKKPDIILLDLIMPVKNGFEALEEIKSDKNMKDVPVLILSNLGKEKIDDMVLNLIPEIIAKSKKIIIFYEDENEIKVGMMDPQDLEIIHILEKKFNRQIIPYYITKNDFLENLSRYNVGMDEKNKANVRMVELLLEHGHYSKASDIHIEPYKKIVIVRFRIDGVLHDVLEIPKNLLSLIISRIKILSKMRIDEHFAAQDGKFQFKVKNDQIDVRVSIVPITEGENVVMRLLSTKSRKMDLDSLGLDSADLDKIKKAIKSPHGMILVTGPTGSGKTTTIYEFLKILNTKEIHIATIEDPVEYDIEGISQIQVNKKTNLTFANGLRAIVRQDPDIIMIGEIRDHETADIAVNSGLTGHLVLSTLHANDAATTLPRLLDMGIEPYLIASTVRVVIAQS